MSAPTLSDASDPPTLRLLATALSNSVKTHAGATEQNKLQELINTSLAKLGDAAVVPSLPLQHN